MWDGRLQTNRDLYLFVVGLSAFIDFLRAGQAYE
jgi:hypothetical protein